MSPRARVLSGACAVLLSAVALALVSSAWGDQQTVQDPAGDSVYCGAPTDPCPPVFDLKSATAGHGTTTNLFHTFEYYGADTEGGGRGTELEIYINSSTIGQPDFYTLPGSGPTERRLMNSSRHQVAQVVVATLNDTTVAFTFGQSEIGSPSSYRWRAIEMGENVGPDGPADPAKVHDAVPDSGLATHVLSGGGGGGGGGQATAPVRGTTVNATVRSGTVRVQRPGAASFSTLQGTAPIPIRSFLDTTHGTVQLTSATNAQGGTQSALFYSGQFQVLQSRTNALTELRLSQKLSCSSASSAGVSPAARSRRLWGNGKGRFRTRGRYSSAAVRGTKWLTKDSCSSTTTSVKAGAVTVRDFARKRTVNVRAGEKYVASRAK